MLATKPCGVSAVPRSVLLFFCATFLLCTGCRQEAYRRGTQDPSGRGLAPVVEYHEPVPGEPVSTPPTCTKYGPGCVAENIPRTFTPQHFSLAYVEFDDAGEFWSIGNERADRTTTTADWPVSQLQKAIALVNDKKDEAKKTHRKLLVITFVHGWHNNASPQDETGDQNLRSFKDSLQYLATRKDCSGTNCPIVVGIFFGWRGRLADNLVFHIFTYANRRAAANRVGGVSMTEGVMLLALATKGAPAPYDEANRCQQPTKAMREAALNDPDAGPETSFFVIGHSFGARALLHGVAQSMLALLLERKAQSESCFEQWNKKHVNDQLTEAIIVSPVDLIVLVNPADDALATKSMIEAMKRSGITDTELRRPLIVSIKSDGDNETGFVMYAAQKVTGSRPKMHSYDQGDPHEVIAQGKPPQRPSACEQGQLGLLPQKAYYQHSAGSIPNMDSHYLLQLDDPSKSGKPSVPENGCQNLASSALPGKVFWGEGPGGPTSPGYCFDLVPVKDILMQDSKKGEKNSASNWPDAAPYYRCGSEGTPRFPEPVAVWNDTPFYVMQAPRTLISNHDDIFRAGVFNLLLAMIGGQNSPTTTVAPSATMPSTRQAPVPPTPPKL